MRGPTIRTADAMPQTVMKKALNTPCLSVRILGSRSCLPPDVCFGSINILNGNVMIAFTECRHSFPDLRQVTWSSPNRHPS